MLKIKKNKVRLKLIFILFYYYIVKMINTLEVVRDILAKKVMN